MISGIIKVEVNVEENNDKRIIAAITVYFQTLKNVQLSDKQIFTVFIKQSSAEKLFDSSYRFEMPVQSKPQCFQACHRVKRPILFSRFTLKDFNTWANSFLSCGFWIFFSLRNW